MGLLATQPKKAGLLANLDYKSDKSVDLSQKPNMWYSADISKAPFLSGTKPDFTTGFKNLSAPSMPLDIRPQGDFSGQEIRAPRPGELVAPSPLQRFASGVKEQFNEALTGGTKRREFEQLTGRRPETFAEQLTVSGLVQDNPILPFLTRSKPNSGVLSS